MRKPLVTKTVPEVLRGIFGAGKVSTSRTSLAMGRSRSFISTYVKHGYTMKVDTFAEMCDVLGYQVIMRDVRTGEEVILVSQGKRFGGNGNDYAQDVL